MTIDTKRLATDAAYWGECGAPEDATHYDVADGEPNAWMKKDGDYWHAWVSSGNWNRYAADIHEVQSDFIPRPQTQEAEWKDGLPKTNTDCEMSDDNGVFCEVRIVSRVDGYAIGWCADREQVYFSKDPGDFRPIRTPEQRQRDELIKIIKEADEMAYSFRPDDLADAIIAEGWIKP